MVHTVETTWWVCTAFLYHSNLKTTLLTTACRIVVLKWEHWTFDNSHEENRTVEQLKLQDSWIKHWTCRTSTWLSKSRIVQVITRALWTFSNRTSSKNMHRVPHGFMFMATDWAREKLTFPMKLQHQYSNINGQVTYRPVGSSSMTRPVQKKALRVHTVHHSHI